MSEENQIVKPGSTVTRQGFGTQEVESRRETQGNALAARQQAEVQARYIVAMQRPRSIDDVRVRMLSHCQRTGFAEKAEYAKPVAGSKVRGPSIRFVETALQEYGNVLPDSYVTYDDEKLRIIRVTMTDLERNITYSDDVVVEKVIERKSPKRGDVVLGARENSQGGTTYRIQAANGDAELENRFAAETSKKIRKLGLRILPIDLVEECIAKCNATLDGGGKDPAAERKKVADAFSGIGVMPRDLEAYLGHQLASTSPAEMSDLRKIFQAIRDGETTWVQVMEELAPDQEPAPQGDLAEKVAAAKGKAT